jgi:xylulokinase
MREALRQAGMRPKAVEAIGITGQLDGCLAVGQDGRPLTPCLIWMDRRARLPISEAMLRRVKSAAGVTPDPGHMAAKVRWLLDNAPESANAACFHQPVSYMVRRLTGEDVYDHGLASTTMLYSLTTRAYDNTLLRAFGVSKGRLPRIARAEDLAGLLTESGAALSGLPVGTPVAVGTGDDFASPLGAGLVDPGSVACVSGTAEVVGALSEIPIIDAEGLVETHCYPGGSYFIENPGWLSGGSLAWFTDVFRLAGIEELSRRAEAAPPGSAGVLFLPALSGSMTPEWVPAARGCFYGLTAAHTTGHMARAVLEGCAFAMRDVIDRLKKLSVPADRVLLMGGGANGRLWAQIRADVCGMTVRRIVNVDTAPVGAAMLGAVAAGLRPDLRTCAGELKTGWEDFPPNPETAAACEKAYRSYRRLFDCLRPMFAQGEDS